MIDKVPAPFVRYSENNSGGREWLSEADHQALRDAGWVVGDGWMPDCYRQGVTLAEAIREFDSVTSQNSAELGCYSCCGPPHSFEFHGENGEYDYYSPEPPMFGEPYGGEG